MRGLLLLFQMTGIPRLVVRLMLDRRVPLGVKLLPPAAIVYLISRIDIVPDIVPVLGRIDDVLVLIVSLVLFLALAPKDVVLEHLRRGGNDPGTKGRDSRPRPNVIDGSYRIADDDEPGQ